MDINAAFPTKYLAASDLMGHEVACTMSDVRYEIMPDDEQKPVLYFQGKQKGLVLNKTNANVIAEQHGHETDEWNGKQIVLFPTQTDFGGRTVPCIRVKISQKAKPVDPPAETVGDNIPF